MATATGSTVNSRWRANISYSTSSSNTEVTITATLRLENRGSYKWSTTNCDATLSCNGQSTSVSDKNAGGNSSGGTTTLCSKTFTVTRGTSAKTVTLTGKVTCGGTIAPGTSTATASISIPAKPSYTVKYNANGGEGTIANQTKWYGTALTLSDGSAFSKSGHELIKWNTSADGSGTSYNLKASYTSNAGVTLYAIWQKLKSNAYIKQNGSWIQVDTIFVKQEGSWVEITINEINTSATYLLA